MNTASKKSTHYDKKAISMPQCVCNSIVPALLIIISVSVIPYFIHSTANNENNDSPTGMKANLIRQTSFMSSTD